MLQLSERAAIDGSMAEDEASCVFGTQPFWLCHPALPNCGLINRREEKFAGFSESASENLILTRIGDLRNFRAQPVGGVTLTRPAPLLISYRDAS